MSDQYDVVVLGGGLAGLCLAIQLKQVRPETSILVTEKFTFPLPEAAHKVGESTGELGAFYFREVVGMQEHLEQDQLIKFGLRFFFPAGDNRDITKRVEVGPQPFSKVDTYQIDRGRFENALAARATELGAVVWDGCKVQDVAFGDEMHSVVVDRRGESVTVQGRWVVDATGRGAVLKRKLGLAKSNNHNCNTAWFRIADKVDLDTWSDDPDWHARIPEGNERQLSTNHLVGAGYWVWLIPLASGSHSIGIVADPAFHPFEEFNTFERAMQWLHKYEPQLAEQLEARRHLKQDFRVLKHFSFSCEKVFSTERWCLTGEAGIFLDPFYSPGSDFIAISNSFIADLVVRERNGEDVDELVAFYDEAMLNAFEGVLPLWQDKYPLFANAHVMTAKHCYDQNAYWGFIALPFFQGKFADAEFFAEILPTIIKMAELTRRIQAFFLEWMEKDTGEYTDGFLDILNTFKWSLRSQQSLPEKFDEDALRERIGENLTLLERMVAEMFRKAAQLVGGVPDDRPVNPYAISMDPSRWEADGLFTDGDGEQALVPKDEEMAAELEKIWFDRVRVG
jgi:flavin-dependent dehydrogenase